MFGLLAVGQFSFILQLEAMHLGRSEGLFVFLSRLEVESFVLYEGVAIFDVGLKFLALGCLLVQFLANSSKSSYEFVK